MLLGCYLLENDTELSPTLTQDIERGMTILREIAKNTEDYSLANAAAYAAASHLVKSSNYRDMSEEERELVENYAGDRAYIRSSDYVPLARYYEGKVGTADFAGPSYRTVRELLIKGSSSRYEDVRNACNAVLDEWGVRPQPPQPSSAAKKAADALKVTGVVGGIGLTLWLWSLIGMALLTLAAMVNAIMIPIILIGLVVGAVVKTLRR